MKKLCVLVVLGLLILGASCDTKNIGTLPGPFRMLLTVTVPNGMYGNENATWGLNVQGGTGPYTVAWNWGGGADPNTLNDGGAGPNFSSTVQMQNDTAADVTYTGSVTVTDSAGLSVSEPFTFTVGPIRNTPPVVDSATFAGAVLTVMASDADGDAMTITVTPPAGASVDAATKNYVDGGITFTFSADDFVAGVNGNVTVVANDGTDDSDPATAALAIAPFVANADTLYALVSGSTVIIYTGATANPFQYLNGVGLTVSGDLGYTAGTFNAGAPGGGAGDVDGAWTAMNPAGGFLLPPDNFIVKTDIGGGRGRIDFNLTPIGGSDQNGMSGALINFELGGSAGSYALGFQDVLGVERTYYTDGASTIYMWGTLHADETGTLTAGITVDNTFTVN